MLLLCIGPDTFRAQEKAHELEAAFKQKYDPAGSSVERIAPGKEAVDEIVQRANTTSLFSPRRFMRTTDLLKDCSKTKQAALIQALSRDSENVIVVSVESEPLSATTMKAFSGEAGPAGEKIPKIIKYEFPEQEGTAFRNWLTELAKRIGVKDQSAVDQIAEATDGDSWFAWNELLKLAAGGQTEAKRAELSPTIYLYAEQFLQNQTRWHTALMNEDISSQLLTTLVSQARAALRVRDGATEDLHPYVVKKMRIIKYNNLEALFARSLVSLLAQRAGYGTEDEVAATM